MKWRHAQRILAGIVVCGLLALSFGLVFTLASGAKLLSIQSRSMTPALQKGDLITVTRVPANRLAVGDVITFVNPHNAKQTITHRIVQLPSNRTDNLFVTKGDANNLADTPITANAILGRVDHGVPLAGFLIDFVRKPLGLLTIIYVPAIIIIVQEFRRLARYYKQQQPYRLAGRRQRHQKTTTTQHVAQGAKVLVFCLVVAAAVVIPVKAALVSEATLTNNSILATKPADHILLRRVEFECSLDNTESVNKLPAIIMYNPTNKDINTGGWYLQSREGKLVTFRPQTWFDAKDDYDIEPDLQAGVHYEGDFLALYDNTGKLVDAISWGTDTTYLNPSLPGTQDGTLFRRVGLIFDTDTAVDWAVSVGPCTTDLVFTSDRASDI